MARAIPLNVSSDLNLCFPVTSHFLSFLIKVMYITQILTGHACVNKHLKEMGFADTKACDHCNDPIESIEHILGDCPKYSQIRVNIFSNNILLAKHFWELNLKDLVKFFKRTKRFSYFK